MSRIRSKDTKPEMVVRKFLFSQGFRFRLHSKKLPGKPDVILPKYKAVIFINGCFWHGHGDCKYFVVPKTRTAWWVNKIDTTKKNDQENVTKLIQGGWKVITIFECDLKVKKRDRTLTLITSQLKTK